jgi:hypothetical protein
MVSHPPSLSDRHSNSKSGAGNSHGKAEKTPGTPRREGGVGKEKAIQDPVLQDYVGCTLPEGQNDVANTWGTGAAVAVKQIKLGDLPKSELRMIEVHTVDLGEGIWS